MSVEMFYTAIVYILGILTGIFLTAVAYIFGRDKPNFIDNVKKSIIKHQGYITGSDSDGETFPEDEAVKIK